MGGFGLGLTSVGAGAALLLDAAVPEVAVEGALGARGALVLAVDGRVDTGFGGFAVFTEEAADMRGGLVEAAGLGAGFVLGLIFFLAPSPFSVWPDTTSTDFTSPGFKAASSSATADVVFSECSLCLPRVGNVTFFMAGESGSVASSIGVGIPEVTAVAGTAFSSMPGILLLLSASADTVLLSSSTTFWSCSLKLGRLFAIPEALSVVVTPFEAIVSGG